MGLLLEDSNQPKPKIVFFNFFEFIIFLFEKMIHNIDFSGLMYLLSQMISDQN